MRSFLPAFPLHFAPTGAVAAATTEQYVRDLIGQVLFTTPGERVNRPGFGCGLRKLLFDPQDDTMVANAAFIVEKGLHDALFGLVSDLKVRVTSEGARLTIFVRYTLTGQENMQEARFVS